MPKPLVSGLGSWRHGPDGRARGSNKLTISGSAGFSTIASPFLRQMAAGSPDGIGRTDTTATSGGSRR